MYQLTTKRFAFWQTVVFCGIILFASCNRDNLLGLEVQPEDALEGMNLIDTFTIKARTIIPDADRSSQLRNYVGLLSNEVFGDASATLYINFNLESENVRLDLPASAYVVDSLVLNVVPFYAYGDSTKPAEFEVFTMEEAPDINEIYTSDKSFRTDDVAIGSHSFQYRTSNLLDTAYRGEVIHLDKDIGSYLLQGIGTGYTNSDQFKSYLKGLAIKPTGGEAIFNLVTVGDGRGLTLYYHYTDEEGNVVPQSLTYKAANTTSRINEFNLSYKNAIVEEYLNNYEKGTDKLFVQGMSGVKAEIQIPHLNAFALKSHAAIGRASLTVELDDLKPGGIGFDPSSRLYLLDYEVDPSTGDTVQTLTLDYVTSTNRHGGFLENGKYTFDITRQVQRMVDEARSGVLNRNLGFTINAQVVVLNENVCQQNVLKGSDNIVFKLYYTDLTN